MKRVLWVLVWILFCLSAIAAQPARVDEAGTPLYETLGKNKQVVQQLPRGAPVAASNYPTNGYYKVRTSDGKVGWIHADHLVFKQSPKDDDIALWESSPNQVADKPVVAQKKDALPASPNNVPGGRSPASEGKVMMTPTTEQ